MKIKLLLEDKIFKIWNNKIFQEIISTLNYKYQTPAKNRQAQMSTYKVHSMRMQTKIQTQS